MRTTQPLLFLCLLGTTGPVHAADLTLSILGKTYTPDPVRVVVDQSQTDPGGNTSVRNVDAEHLSWKAAGYYQRNRDLGQVFTAPRDFRLDALVLRTGPGDSAVKAGAPGAEVFVQFFEVTGVPRVDDNGTGPGAAATHGFSTNHRCDDVLRGVRYRPLRTLRGGRLPAVPPTKDWDGRRLAGDAGRLVYLRWDLASDQEPTFRAGRRYAFMVGFTDPGPQRAFTLGNHNAASSPAPPVLNDSTDAYVGGWGLRREGNGTVPPRMLAGDAPPRERAALQAESLFASHRAQCELSPTTDGYPDVDTYRDLTFFLEAVTPTYRNPLVGGTLADPAVLHVDDTYYLYATGEVDGDRGTRVYTSPDLIHWKRGPVVFRPARPHVWAPDVWRDPDSGRYYLYYTVDKTVGVAEADGPLGPFVAGPRFFSNAIDAHLFRDDDGRLYLYYVQLPGFRIHVQPLASPTRPQGEPHLILRPRDPWETRAGHVTEGPWLIKHAGRYYLLYSGSGANTPDYAVGYAVADSPLGPFVRAAHNPILHRGEGVYGPGHGCAVQDGAGQWWHVYHQKASTRIAWDRFLCLDPLWFDAAGRLHTRGTRGTDQPGPSAR